MFLAVKVRPGRLAGAGGLGLVTELDDRNIMGSSGGSHGEATEVGAAGGVGGHKGWSPEQCTGDGPVEGCDVKGGGAGYESVAVVEKAGPDEGEVARPYCVFRELSGPRAYATIGCAACWCTLA